ncbi:hypothetical protein C7H19_23460 [Aphanothece hegewaldii CCALA 016]|uniref:Uncharacterized protein n=1 Tax=Aphanothece hegewaldii CCALA 016 TaxID=2107694 RepID=A0A2T1LR71_9CHRO|nr:hypothetical protein [Aphanothece hegewaldii]PSF30986.1 hypothetical protein C7H19_23460 [Aphanothece hegewaldii CCALA 016]
MQSLKRELKKISSLALFFFIGFGYILLIMKLFLKEYDISAYVLSKALVGSIVAAKAVVLMEMTPWMERFQRSPRYISVLYKTFIYTLAVLVIGLIERLIDGYLKTKSLSGAIETLIHSEHFYPFLATILCIAVVFLMHNIFTEIDTYLGKGNLLKFFLNRPQTQRNRVA